MTQGTQLPLPMAAIDDRARLPGAAPMIGLPLGSRIWLAAGVTDLRRGMDGLASLAQTALQEDPFAGHLFVFRGRRGDLIKIYDFGDSWEHRVKVERILPADPSLKSPICLTGANACPPEDVGGAPGYIEFLNAIDDPSHEEHEEMLEWCGGQFDPTALNIEDINARLSEVKL